MILKMPTIIGKRHKMEEDGDIFALIKEECELDDEWLKEREEIRND